MTNEIKAKVFAKYLKQKARNTLGSFDIFLDGIFHEDNQWWFSFNSNTKTGVDIRHLKLILKPLSSISDEDAIEVARIAMRRHNRHYKQEEISYLIHEISKETDNKIFFAEVYLLINNLPHYVIRLEKNDVCTSELRTKERGGFYTEKDYFTPNTFEIYQFLQSKGYDLPHYLLGGKTLHESGLAIYEKEVTL